MSRRAGRSAPTPEDLELWDVVARSVSPLRRHRRIEAKTEEVRATEEPRKVRNAAKAPHPAVTAREKPAAPPPPSLAPLDRRTKARLAKGAVAIDGRIDLHGLTQAAAHARLRRFLVDAQTDGRKIVLVITGKGKASPGPGEDDRGVLRRMVPVWLAAADLRAAVVGFEEAGRGHGGAGALYVRIRRRRDDRA